MTNEGLVLMYQHGDNEALDRLLQQTRGAIYTIVKKYHAYRLPYIDQDDLMQEAHLAAINAAKMFDVESNKRTTFSSYMMGAIDHRMLYVMRQGYKKIDQNKISLDNKIHNQDDETTFAECIPSNKNYYEEVEQSLYNLELRKELEQAMNANLSLQQKQVLKLKHGWDGKALSNSNISKCLGICRDKVSTLNHNSLNILSNTEAVKELGKEYYGEKYLKMENTFKCIELENLKCKWMVTI